MTKILKKSKLRRLICHGGNSMNLAFALNSYNKTKSDSEHNKYDGYQAVKVALDRAIIGMHKLTEEIPSEEKERYFEQALSSIYFLQKCLDFEKGGELARNLFKVYEYCRVQILQDSTQEIYIHGLTNAIEFIKTISEGWNGIRSKI